MVPAFGVTGLVLAGRRIRGREVLALLVGDRGRAVRLRADRRGPTARGADPPRAGIAEQVLDARWETFSKSLGRRWQASLGGAELAGWITVGAVMVLAWGYAGLVAAGRMGPHATRPLRDRPTRAAVLGLAVLGTVGLVANDSSVAVPLTMLIVVAPAGILQAVAPAARDRGDPVAPVPAAGPPATPVGPVVARPSVGQAS